MAGKDRERMRKYRMASRVELCIFAAVAALGRVDGFLQEKAAASCRTAEQAAPPAAMEQTREKSGTL